jgi:Na+-transporting methylmalonyl-CoA/oxaloacetate decarboxylase gamma subunit
MRSKQTGVSLSGLIIVFVILIFLALLGFKVGPAVAEFYTAKKLITSIAQERKGGSVAEIRKAWDTKTMIDEVKVITAADLEITKDGTDVLISFAYKKEVPLFANVGLYIDFAATSKE